MKIIGISGSLRPDSFNSKLLKAAGERLPADCSFEIISANLPLYDQTLDGDHKPEAVVQFKQAIDEADGLLIASPEYNYSFSGVIKNAIDWASRPAFESPLKHKPIALMSASMSPVGGVRAQAQLKPVLSGTLSVLYPAIEMSVPTAQKVFDADGRCLDDATSDRLTRFIEGYVAWVSQQA